MGAIDMSWLLKNHTYSRVSILGLIAGFSNVLYRVWGLTKPGPIGVDMDDDTVKMVQLTNNGKDTSLTAVGSEKRSADVKPGSGNWQRWAIEAINKLTANGKFRGRAIIAAMPASEVFIDHIKMPKINDGNPKHDKERSGGHPFYKKSQNASQNQDKLKDVISSKIKQKLPFEYDDAMIKYITTEQDNVVVIAIERKKIDRHLAIYEQANLQIKAIGVWPTALTNTYTTFFGRRKTDIEAVVMLLDIEPNRTNVVICRHKNLLFARSIPVGTKQLESDEMVARLVLELTACRRCFASMYKKARMERVIFLSTLAVDGNICTAIAKQLEMPAQMGDCLAAVEIPNPRNPGIDRRGCQVNWATAFGLSLS